MTKPNFFIVGAPKTGSTALYYYLEQHPQIFMANPKELFFFNDNFNQPWIPKTSEEYLSYFREALPEKGYIAIGEGSTTYLSSEQALRDIYDFNHDAKIIAMVRNPIHMLQSWHNHMYYRGEEDIEDFETAWQLQALRAEGYHIPKKVLLPIFVQYAKMGRLGEQIARLYNIFPDNQVKVIIFDDFKINPRNVYLDVLGFLGVPDDGCMDFPLVYESREAQRGHWLIKWLANPPSWIYPFKEYVKINHRNKIDFFLGLLTTKAKRSSLPDSFYTELVATFQDDVAYLSELLDRDLTYWLQK